MAIYTVVTEKYMFNAGQNEETWSNTWHVNASDLGVAQDHGADIAAAEAQVYWDNVSIIRIDVAPLIGGGRVSGGVAIPGGRADGEPGTQLPLFNTVYVRFYVDGGRTFGLHFRPPVDEADVDAGRLNNDVHGLFQAGLVSDIVALGFVCNHSGGAVTGGVADRAIHDRQTGWSRRHRPGFHRGYVPDV